MLFNQCLLPQPPTFSPGVSVPRRIHQPLPSLGTRSGSGGDRPHHLGGTWAAVTSAVTPLSPKFGVAAALLLDPMAEHHQGPDPCRELRPEAAAPNPGWYLRRSLGSIKREKTLPGINLRAGV